MSTKFFSWSWKTDGFTVLMVLLVCLFAVWLSYNPGMFKTEYVVGLALIAPPLLVGRLQRQVDELKKKVEALTKASGVSDT